MYFSTLSRSGCKKFTQSHQFQIHRKWHHYLHGNADSKTNKAKACKQMHKKEIIDTTWSKFLDLKKESIIIKFLLKCAKKSYVGVAKNGWKVTKQHLQLLQKVSHFGITHKSKSQNLECFKCGRLFFVQQKGNLTSRGLKLWHCG